MKKVLFLTMVLGLASCGSLMKGGSGKSRKLKLEVVNVPEEGGIKFQQITRDGSDLSHPSTNSSGWFSGRMLSVSPDGQQIAYIDYKNATRNVYLKSTDVVGASVQRTFRAGVNTVCYSPDGQDIVFSETRDNSDAIYLISTGGGNIVRQITSGFNPSYSLDGRHIFFTRNESTNSNSSNLTKTIWSYDTESGMLSNYSNGNNPTPVYGDPDSFICERNSETGYGEIWKINYKTGTESIILSNPGRNYTSPVVSPDGQWILVVGNSSSNDKALAYNPKSKKHYVFSTSKQNTDIYAVRIDGSQLIQLTYHKGNDFCPVWSPDGKMIYFLSQRGSATGEYNIWKMDFKVR